MKYMTVDPKSSSNVGIFTIKNQQLIYDFTLEFWIKCKFNATTTTDRSLFEVIQFDDVEKVNKTIIKIYVPKNSKNYKYAIDDTEIDVPHYKMDNMWNHIAMVFDTGTSCAIYLNGNNIAIKNMSLMPDIKLKALDEFKFYSYKSTSNCYVYIYNINITKAIRYNNLFKTDTIISNSNYGLKLDLDNEMTTKVIKPEVNMSAEDSNNIIFLPFQQNTGLDEAKNHTMTVTGSTYLSLVSLTSEDYFYAYDKYYDLQIAVSTYNGQNGNSIAATLENTDSYDELTMEMFYKTSTNTSVNRTGAFSLGSGIKQEGTNKKTNTVISNTNIYTLTLSPLFNVNDLRLHHYSITYSNPEKRVAAHRDGILTWQTTLIDENDVSTFRYYFSPSSFNFVFKLYANYDKACYVRLSNKALYPNRHFDPTILLFKPITDNNRNGTDKIKYIDDEDIALLYPGTTSPKSIYERAYTKNIDFKNNANFQVDNDSTLDIKLDTTHNTSYKYSGKAFLSYPAIITTSNSDYRNMIIFRNHCPETKSWTLEFFVHMDATILTMEMIDIFFASGISGNGCIGMQANGKGLVEIKYNTNINYSTNILNQPTTAINSIDNVINIDDWNHIALSCNVTSSTNTTLTFYINGQAVAIYNQSQVLISTLHRLFFFTHYIDYPFKLTFTGIKVTMKAKTEEELVVK